MRTLIYKRTHNGDPDPETGEFGCNNCMKTVRGRQFDAVIGIGGIGREPESHGIAGKLTWIGIGPHKIFDDSDNPGCPRVTFDHFLYFGEHGPLLEERYQALARRMYDKNVRVLMHSPSPAGGRQVDLDRDVRKILSRARAAPSSARPVEREFGDINDRCRPRSRDVC